MAEPSAKETRQKIMSMVSSLQDTERDQVLLDVIRIAPLGRDISARALSQIPPHRLRAIEEK
jgi:hypothetical protein